MDNSAAIAAALATGDITGLNAEQRGEYYKRVCDSLQLNYLTSPLYFQVGEDGRESLAVNKSGAAALRKIHGISIYRTERDVSRGLAMFTVYGKDKDGREDSATGVADLEGFSGERLANAIMGAETKAKNRLTISLSGVGFLDSSEAGKPSARPVDIADTTLKIPELAVRLGLGVNQAPATESRDTRPQEIPSEQRVVPPQALFNTPLAAEPAPVAPQPQLQPEAPAAPAPAPEQPVSVPVEEKIQPLGHSDVPIVGQATVVAQANTRADIAAEDIPATAAEYQQFVTQRASKLLRDVLQKANVRNANSLIQEYFIRESGKPTLKKISAPTWERMLSALEACKAADEMVALLKGGKK